MSKSRRSPFSAAHYHFEGHKRGGRAKFAHERGSTGGAKQEFAAPGKHFTPRADRVSRRQRRQGGGPAGPQPDTLNQPGYMLGHFRRSRNVIDRRPDVDSFSDRFVGEPRGKQEGAGAWSEPSIFEPMSLPPRMTSPPSGSTWSPRETLLAPSGRATGGEPFSRRSSPPEGFWKPPSSSEPQRRGGRTR